MHVPYTPATPIVAATPAAHLPAGAMMGGGGSHLPFGGLSSASTARFSSTLAPAATMAGQPAEGRVADAFRRLLFSSTTSQAKPSTYTSPFSHFPSLGRADPSTAVSPTTSNLLLQPKANLSLTTPAADATRQLRRRAADFFPKMHVQVPTRVVFITGLKQIRASLEGIDVERSLFGPACWATHNTSSQQCQGQEDSSSSSSGFQRSSGVTLEASEPQQLTRPLIQQAAVGGAKVLLWSAPGLAMAPLCSLLEASNAGSAATGLAAGSDPLWQRWRRGFGLRLIREAVFAVGINEAADACGHLFAGRLSSSNSNSTANATAMLGGAPSALEAAAGSVAAGVVAGYFSHVPHVLSALRLMNPSKGYAALWEQLWRARSDALARRSLESGASAAASRAGLGAFVAPFFAGGGRLTGGSVIAPQRARPLFHLFVAPLLAKPRTRNAVAKLLTVVAPIGVVRRSVQIAGTFVIINGITHSLRGII